MTSAVLVCNHTGQIFDYEIKIGLDIPSVFKMQMDWSSEKSKILQELISKHGDKLEDEDFAREVIIENNMADLDWAWDKKLFHCRSSDFIWFLLVADGKVQGACVVYHPKQSRIDSQNIFYIDYIAAAYWNRDRPSYVKKFSGIGSRLISFVVSYAKDNLNYRYGFCLHSLPTAETYYRYLGMTEFDNDPTKENLKYFEACDEIAAKIARAS